MIDRGGVAMVLVVQADEVGALLASRALRRAGYAPRLTGSAAEAVKLLARKSFAAVVLADSLPGGPPWEVLAAAVAKSATPVIMVVATTGEGDDSPERTEGTEDAAAEALRRGAADVVRRTGDWSTRLPGTIDRAVRLAEADQVHSLRAAIVESSDDAIVSVSLDGTVISWHQGAERAYGYTAAEAVGRSILMLMPPGHPDEVPAILGRLVGGARLCHYQASPVRKSGAPVEVSLALSPLLDPRRRPAGIATVARDLGERRQLEELHRHTRELEHARRTAVEANRLKSEFLAAMSHELRTPLNAIVGFAELLHDGKAGDVNPRQRRYLEHVLTSSRHLLELLNGLLDLAKLEAGKMEFRPQRLSPTKLAAEVIDALHAQAAVKGIQVELETSPEVGQVVADPAKLKQVFFNYLSNALRHTPPGGRVTVRLLAQEPRQFRLEVEDTGEGIQPDQLARLFTDFHQLTAAGSGELPLGTGLGLAVTKRLIEAQGGSVGARSAPGTGSLFFATLPRRLSRRIGSMLPPLPAVAS
ncbi:MAG TPA: ATP-binding protein [Thermoanaerobaculia bacterium]|nr:ATP-binding protein [Thermoanaerobaculia bacterium]